MTTISFSPVAISPNTLTKLGPNDAVRLYEYIMAIEKENKSKNDERIFMEKYIDSIKAELQESNNASRGWKSKQSYFNAQIYRLSHDNMAILAQLRARQDRIMELEQQIDRLTTTCSQNQKLMQQKEKEYHNEIERFVEQQRTLSQSSTASSAQLEALSKANKTLGGLLDNQKNRNALLQKEINAVNLRNEAQTKKSVQLQAIVKNLQTTIANYEKQIQYLKQIEYNASQMEAKYKGESEEWTSKQKDLQQFVIFVKNNISSMENKIQDQDRQIQTLRKTNEQLRGQILEHITKMTSQTQAKKNKELADVRMELASCKGKLAEKQRQLSSSSSRMGLGIGPMEEYSLRMRLGTEEVEDDKKSQTYSDRNIKTGSNSSITNGHKGRVKNFNSQNIVANS